MEQSEGKEEELRQETNVKKAEPKSCQPHTQKRDITSNNIFIPKVFRKILFFYFYQT